MGMGKYGGIGKPIPMEVIEQIKRMRAEGASVSEVAEALEVSRTTVLNYEKEGRLPKPTRVSQASRMDYIPEEEPESPRPYGYEMPKREADAYDVLLFNVKGMGNAEISRMFKHYPNYWDMRRLCRDGGFTDAMDFFDYDDCFQKGIEEVNGEILSIGGAKIGEFLITILMQENVHPQELFR